MVMTPTDHDEGSINIYQLKKIIVAGLPRADKRPTRRARAGTRGYVYGMKTAYYHACYILVNMLIEF